MPLNEKPEFSIPAAKVYVKIKITQRSGVALSEDASVLLILKILDNHKQLVNFGAQSAKLWFVKDVALCGTLGMPLNEKPEFSIPAAKVYVKIKITQRSGVALSEDASVLLILKILDNHKQLVTLTV